MSKALQYFEVMVFCNQLDYQDEKPKCDLIRNILRAINGIESRAVYNIKEKKIVFVNKLIYWGNDLMIIGYSSESNFKVDDYGITWREVRRDD